MLSVYQHWDPLKVCLVGRSYPPEFYSFIKNPKVRNVLERIAIETEEDYQKIITLLESFNVLVIRTDISDNFDDYFDGNRYTPPPMTPRDFTGMMGDVFCMPGNNYGDNYIPKKLLKDYLTEKIKSASTAESHIPDDLDFLQQIKKFKKEDFEKLKEDLISAHTETIGSNYKFPNNKKVNPFQTIRKFLIENNCKIIYDSYVNTATTFRIGKDLYVSKINMSQTRDHLVNKYTNIFPNHRSHILNNIGHCDGSFCPVKPGLIITYENTENYDLTFPGWEIISLPGQGWEKVKPFLDLKDKNSGKWWIPGEEYNDDLTDFVETWLKDWVTYVEETVFDVNMLVIDQNNVICNNYNEKVFDAFHRYGITPHVINFRHRYFWDGGIHCITSDISREGEMVDYFPERSANTRKY